MTKGGTNLRFISNYRYFQYQLRYVRLTLARNFRIVSGSDSHDTEKCIYFIQLYNNFLLTRVISFLFLLLIFIIIFIIIIIIIVSVSNAKNPFVSLVIPVSEKFENSHVRLYIYIYILRIYNEIGAYHWNWSISLRFSILSWAISRLTSVRHPYRP